MANKSLVANLNLDIKKFTAGLNRAMRKAKAMGKNGGQAGGKELGKGLTSGVSKGMKDAASTIVKVISVAAAVAGATFARIIQRSTQEAGQIEAAEMRFNILTGDAEKSKLVLTQLRQTAMRTGITFEAMAGNVSKFMAFGFSPEKAMELNKGILDVGGAVGMTNTDMKLLGVALSQVAAKGCHGKGSLILMADNSSKVVEDIQPGDELMGPDYKPRTVNFTVTGQQELFKITPDNHIAPFIVNLDHKARVLWGSEVITMTIQECLSLDQPDRDALLWANDDDAFSFKTESMGEGDYYGFNISGDSLYYTSDLTIHHNTGSMEELRQQIAEKGIPIFKALEEQLGVTGAELNKMIQEGKVSSDVVLGLFTDVAKGKGPLKDFAGGADKMATTFQGKIGRMKATWGEFLKQMGVPLIEVLKPIMDDLLLILDRMIVQAPDLGKKIGAIIARLENFTDPLARMSESINGFQIAWDAFVSYATVSFVNQIVRGVIIAFSALGVGLMTLVNSIGNLLYTVFADADFGNALFSGVASWIWYLKSALVGIAASFVKKLEEITPFLKKFGLSDKLQKHSDQAGVVADGLASSSLGQRSAYSNRFQDREDEFGKYWGDQLKTFMSNLNDPQFGLDVAGAGMMRERLEEILAGLKPREKPEQVELDPAGGDPKNPLGAAAGGGFALNGRVDQMNNALMGRNAFAVIAIEAQKANDQREKMLLHLKAIAENTLLPDDGSIGLSDSALGAFA